jgi:hypothetical protein
MAISGAPSKSPQIPPKPAEEQQCDEYHRRVYTRGPALQPSHEHESYRARGKQRHAGYGQGMKRRSKLEKGSYAAPEHDQRRT